MILNVKAIMRIEQIVTAMMALISNDVCKKKIDKSKYIFSHADFKLLYNFSKSHDLAHLVGDALIKNNLISDGEIKSKFEEQIMLSIYRYENINYELNRLNQVINEAKISFACLKGSVIRQYYPEPWMRTSCDIDILVHEEDLESVATVLKEKLGYSYEKKVKGPHDVQMYAPSGVHLELHYTLMEKGIISKADKILSSIWIYANEEDVGSFKKVFSNEMFYFYHIAHMAKHLLSGGCGIKPFVDLWILNHSKIIKIDKEQRDELLLKGGLLKFAKAAETLSEVWFEELEHTETTRRMERYVLQGGVYGTIQNSVVLKQVKSGSKLKYAISRVWLPYDTLKFIYPILQKHKWMVPFCQVRRWVRLLFKGGVKRGINEFSIYTSVTKEQRKDISDFLSKLDLQ